MEQFINDICDEFLEAMIDALRNPISVLIAKSYNKGFEACKKFYRIDDDKFLKEQEEANTMAQQQCMGSYKTTTEVYNGKSKLKIKV